MHGVNGRPVPLRSRRFGGGIARFCCPWILGEYAMSIIAATAANGDIGGGLVPTLLEEGHTGRVLTRRSHALRGVPWSGRVHVVTGDQSDPHAVQKLYDGATRLYYLAHSMSDNKDFAPVEDQCAQIVAAVVSQEGAVRLIYLSGPHPEG